MSIDPIGDLYYGTGKGRIDPEALRKAEEENKFMELRFKQLKEAQRHLDERRRAGLKIKDKAKQQLQTPQPIRQLSRLLKIGDYGNSEWQMHNQAAGYPYAPPQPPVDWERMDYRSRQWNRSFWR